LERAPIGIFRDVDGPVYDDMARAQITTFDDENAKLSAVSNLLKGSDTWQL
jgi:2-oxoglutarate/2-oxoacid ferredoxin oxidoreductase subunit beta